MFRTGADCIADICETDTKLSRSTKELNRKKFNHSSSRAEMKLNRLQFESRFLFFFLLFIGGGGSIVEGLVSTKGSNYHLFLMVDEVRLRFGEYLSQ